MKIKYLIIFLIIIFIIYYLYFYRNFIYSKYFNSNTTIDLFYNDNNVNVINEIAINKTKYIINNIDILNKYIDIYFEPIEYKYLSKILIQQNNKIFVSIASYRDPQCPLTIQDLITKAKHPENLVIVICQQNDLFDIECIDDTFIKSSKATIKIIKMDSKDARGPCWARFIIQQQWSGEQYYLQIDSHTRFVNDWDIKCIQNLEHSTNLSFGAPVCLTNYVSTFNINTGDIEVNPLRGPMFIESIDETDGFFRYNSNYITDLNNISRESKGWSGCFSFSSSQIILDAPYDPYTPFLFFGEEMDIFARLYTRGWLMNVPTEPICFTIFDRSYRKTFWEHPDQAQTVLFSKLRLYIRFGLFNDNNEILNLIPDKIKKELNIYSLGTIKTFDEFINYCFIKKSN